MTGRIGLLALALITSIGTYWAFERGGRDFDVFYAAWKLVLQGHGMDVYRVSPDRFLYAPGFAWLLAPIGWLPRDWALGLWCLAKAAVIGGVLRAFAQRIGGLSVGIAAWAVVLLARPILIDFQYGQVNAFILGACVWALLSHFKKGPPSTWDGLSWAVLGLAAVGKIFPLPLVIVPFFVTHGIDPRRIHRERLAVVVGCALALVAPVLTVGLDGTLSLLFQWKDALVSRGFPLESHNQSFAAFLYHYLTGNPTPVIAMAGNAVPFGKALLTPQELRLLSLAWMFLTSGFLLGWIFSASGKSTLRWIAALIALLILPSHLVWKPYFLMGLPVAILAIREFKRLWPGVLLVFVLINLTGFDFVGPMWGARFEAASLMLWMHLLLIVLVARSPRQMAS